MANTFNLYSQAITFAANKSMLTVFNGTGSGRVLRVSRIMCLNSPNAAVAGVLTTMEICAISASTGGTVIAPNKYNPSQTSLPAQVLCASGSTDIVSNMLRRFMWSTDEPSTGLTIDEVQTFPLFGTVWDIGYKDSSVPKLTLREGEGVTVRQVGSNIVGSVDIMIEFTDAAT